MRDRPKLTFGVIAAGCILTAAHVTAAQAETRPTVPTSQPGLIVGAPNLSPATPDIADTWVLTIGADDYTDAPPLQLAEADATAVDQHLGAVGIPNTQRMRLLGDDATERNIDAAIAWLADRAGPDDSAVLFIAGHATANGTTQTLQTTDGKRLEDTELAELLEPVQARLWIILATCHGGGFTELLTPNRTLTAAAPAGELAYENLDLGFSYLVEYLFNRNLHHDTHDIDVAKLFIQATADLAQDHPDRLPVQVGHDDLTIATS